jgi:hypothetical protein
MVIRLTVLRISVYCVGFQAYMLAFISWNLCQIQCPLSSLSIIMQILGDRSTFCPAHLPVRVVVGPSLEDPCRWST